MPKVWRFANHDEAVVKELCRSLSISPLMARVLVARGNCTPQQVLTFLDAKLTDLHNPDVLPGISEAADRIVNAIRSGRRVTIFGDYDVDGIVSTSILWYCLKLENATVDYHIPSRLTDGYGLNGETLRQFHEEDPDRLVVTVDCGITNIEEVRLARELGLEMIVTDHHRYGDELPEANVLVHPRLPGSEYPFGELCGAGVAFKLAWAICKRLGDGEKSTPRMREFLKNAVGLAAIGTVADVVPLVGENRVIVRYGLANLAEYALPGLQALMKVSGVEPGSLMQSDSEIGFKIAPRINAAGRLGQARLAVELLTTNNNDRANQLANYLDELNKNRRTVETRMLKKAKSLVADHPEWEEQAALVIAQHDWHPGVIGIVANRIAEHYEKPTVLISLDRETNIGQGSGRSFAGFDLHSGLAACEKHLLSFGGHRAAAGVRIHADHINAFRESFHQYVTENHQLNERDIEQTVDAEVQLSEVTLRAVRELDRLGPFGQANTRPVFAATRVELAGPPKTMGDGGRHLSLKVRQYGAQLRAVAFGHGNWAEEIAEHGGPIDLCFSANINRFRGRENVDLFLNDWRPSVSNIPVTS
ncbi:MAG: single-stranded-DNA-specific exonuclease RecJ [Planctomycetaceae bacterium]